VALFLLPGAGGSSAFWRPVASLLAPTTQHHFFAWPGLGNEPHTQDVQSIDDLVAMVISRLSEPSVLIAQSMGGYIALRVALERPELVSHLVLTAASAGLAMDELGALNWRANYQYSFPNAASYITHPAQDLTERLSHIKAPCLLLWGGDDPISPVAVGQKLASLLPNARLVIFENGDHNVAIHDAKEIASLIDAHLTTRCLD
jgi:pimeloyl-ACP methyl ester carboxylesterase